MGKVSPCVIIALMKLHTGIDFVGRVISMSETIFLISNQSHSKLSKTKHNELHFSKRSMKLLPIDLRVRIQIAFKIFNFKTLHNLNGLH